MNDDKEVLQETERMSLPITLEGEAVPEPCIRWLMKFWLISATIKGYTLRYHLTRYGKEVHHAIQDERKRAEDKKHVKVKPRTGVCGVHEAPGY